MAVTVMDNSAGFVATKSYPEASDLPQRTFKLNKYVDSVVRRFERNPERPLNTMRLIGPHGIGKTKGLAAAFAAHDVRVVSVSLAQADFTAFMIPFPEQVQIDPKNGAETDVEYQTRLRLLLLSKFRALNPDDRFVVVLDEFARADKAVMNIVMELTGSRKLGGMELDGLVGVVCLDNPTGGDYYGITSLDPAQADRFPIADFISAADIEWEYAIARMFPESDLSDAFKYWWTLPEWAREKLPPRTLQFVFLLAQDGLPASWALPVIASGRVKLTDGENDQTDVILGALVEKAGFSYSKKVQGPQVPAVLAFADRNKVNVRIIGPQGCGKTEYTTAHLAELGKTVEAFSLSVVSPEDWSIPVPDDGVLSHLRVDRLYHDEPWVLLLDEFSRPERRTSAASMEITGEHQLNGEPLENLQYVVALDNPAKIGNVHFDAGRIDVAQASRFVATVEITWGDIPARQFLDTKYGEAAQPFASWWAEDLDDDARAHVSFRCLEYMINNFQDGLDPALALPIPGSERVPVENHLPALRARLRNQPRRGFAAIVADVDGTIAAIKAGEERVEASVLLAFRNADLIELEKNYDACVRLVGALGKDKRIALAVRSRDEKGRFWTRAMKDFKVLAAADKSS